MPYYSLLIILIQSISEFLPISSSAHLALFGFYTKTIIPIPLTIALHVGSLLALILYYFPFIWRTISAFINRTFNINTINSAQDKAFIGYALRIIVICLPSVIVGFLIKDRIALLHVPQVIGWGSIVGGMLLIVSDIWGDFKPHEGGVPFTYASAFMIGVWQILALIPGMSRMGMILVGARFFKMDRFFAINLAFITAMPMIFGALTLHVKDIQFSMMIIAVSILSLITLALMLAFAKRIRFVWFGLYRIALGTTILLY